MELYIAVLILSVVAFVFHLFISKKPKTKFRIVELLLMYQLIFNLGILGFISFYALTFMPQLVAAYLDWPTCPFQQELGNANLGFGVIGILGIWFRKHFWTATVIGASIWLFADGLGHFIDILLNKNYSPGNTGTLLYSDLLIPVVLVILLILYWKWMPKKIKY